jgi:hypothetical protein
MTPKQTTTSLEVSKLESRAQRAARDLESKLPPDTMGNLGLHESYRQALEDMVRWIDIDEKSQNLTGVTS